MSEVTEWYPASVKPVRAGFYQVKNVLEPRLPPMFNYWNGISWTGAFLDIAECRYGPSYGAAFQDREWRGLKEPS